MKIRAAIFDIYNTLLAIGPPPADAEARWTRLLRSISRANPRLTLKEFAAASEAVIAQEHDSARKAGIEHPEIFWPAVACAVMPELVGLKPIQLDRFLVQHAALHRRVRLMPGAAGVLRLLSREKVLLGLVSNSQPYTLAELDTSLSKARLSSRIFAPGLSFLSFQAGFSKPEPHVFRWLSARLNNDGITADEALIVGDRLDNDIAPARVQGFQTWHLISRPEDRSWAGDWMALGRALKKNLK